MALTSLKAPESKAKAETFIKSPVTTIPAQRARAQKFSEEEDEMYLKAMFFGGTGTGKTYIVRSLLELGFKVLVISTDVGGDGLNTVKIPMRAAGTWKTFKHNLRAVDITGYDNVESFFIDPEKCENMEDIYDWDPDFIFWDGMSGWQITDIGEKVGDYESGKNASEAERDGLQMNQQKWGQIQRATIRGLENFCSMRNKKTGRMWHKIVTCHESLKSKGNGQGGFVESREPLLQGAGGLLARGAFDLIIRTVVVSDLTDEDGANREFFYILKPHQNLAAKVRGFALPSKMKADSMVLIPELFKQMGIELPTQG